MKFTQLFNFRRNNRTEVTKRLYIAEQVRVVRNILDDAEKGYVRFSLENGARQVQCDFDWFLSVTDGCSDNYVFVLRHCLLSAINILLGANGEKQMSVDDTMPVFLMLDGKPVVQYTFWGNSHVRCYKYKEELKIEN